MDLGLSDKVAVVTGASQGIGKAIAITLAQEGAKVVVVDINAERGAQVVREIAETGGKAMLGLADVSNLEDVVRMVEQVKSAFGSPDILVNDAAAPRTFAEFWEVGPDIWKQNVDVNLYGTMNCSRAVIQQMVEKRFGRIVNVSSDSGRVGELKCAWYSASKAGVLGFTKGLAKDVGRHGITVNNVCPGFTMVERYEEQNKRLLEKLGKEKFEERQGRLLSQYPMRKLGTPQDLADTVAFLCSTRAGHITGQTLSVDGGYTMI